MKALPHPLLSLVLLATWLALNASLAPIDVGLGIAIALALPLLLRPIWPDRLRLRRPGVALRLALRVLRDIVVANIEVARRILGPEAAIRPRFVEYPLTIRNRYGIAVLGGIITMTPGTLTADVLDGGRTLLIHAFNVEDEDALRRDIRERYERPLEEIFP
jgi:multicomponent K+:H+ antiporter subunit E